MIRALAITVSNRASAGVYEDRSGPVLVAMLRQAGCDVVDGPLVIPDGEAVEQVLRDSVTAEYDVAVTTGGTGLTPTDQTPEMTRRVIDREIPGIPEALRQAGATAGIPSAILSRGLAGVASRTLIVNLPGSSGGVRDGMAVLRQVLVHAVDQIRGGDHPRAEQPGGQPGVPSQAGATHDHGTLRHKHPVAHEHPPAHENGGAREHDHEATDGQDTPSDVSEDREHRGHHENPDPPAASADSAEHSAEIA